MNETIFWISTFENVYGYFFIFLTAYIMVLHYLTQIFHLWCALTKLVLTRCWSMSLFKPAKCHYLRWNRYNEKKRKHSLWSLIKVYCGWCRNRSTVDSVCVNNDMLHITSVSFLYSMQLGEETHNKKARLSFVSNRSNRGWLLWKKAD